MASSWKYTVNIPLWILGKDSDGENVALYRVNVLLQPPDATEAPSKPPFFVLRRYSQFRQLYIELRSAFPAAMQAKGMMVPPKHAFNMGNTKELLDRRREELERWMWRLIAKADIARSSQLKMFLDFDKALQRAQQHRAGGLHTPNGTMSPVPGRNGLMSAASSEAGDYDDTRSEISTFSTAPSTSAAADRSSMLTSSGPSPDGWGASSSAGGTESPGHAPPGLRLGLRLEQRSDVRKLVEMLQKRLRQATTDLQAAVSQLMAQQQQQQQQEAAAPPALLAAHLAANSVVQPSARDQELQSLLAEAERDIARLQGSLREQALEGQQQLEAVQGQLEATQQLQADTQARLSELEGKSASKISMLSEQVADLQQQLEENSADTAQLLSRSASRQGSARGADLSPSIEQLHQLQQQVLSLEAQLQEAAAARAAAEAAVAAAQAAAAAVREEAAEASRKQRADHLLLAKEIKKLRADLAAAEKQREQPVADAAQPLVAEEVAALQGKLAEAEAQLAAAVTAESAAVKEAAALREKLDQAAAELAAAAAVQPAAVEEAAALRDKLAKVEAQLAAATAAVHAGNAAGSQEVQLRQQLAELQEQADILQAEKASLQEALAMVPGLLERAETAEAAVAKLQDSVQELNGQLAEAAVAAATLAKVEGEVAALRSECESLRGEREQLSEQLRRNEEAEAREAVEGAEQLEQLHVSLSAANQQLQQKTALLNSVVEQNRQLAEQLALLQVQVSSLMMEAGEQVGNGQLHDDDPGIEADGHAAEVRSKLLAENRLLQAQLAQLQLERMQQAATAPVQVSLRLSDDSTMASLRAELASLHSSHSTLVAQHEALQAELAEAHRQADGAGSTTDLEDLRSQIASMHSSHQQELAQVSQAAAQQLAQLQSCLEDGQRQAGEGQASAEQALQEAQARAQAASARAAELWAQLQATQEKQRDTEGQASEVRSELEALRSRHSMLQEQLVDSLQPLTPAERSPTSNGPSSLTHSPSQLQAQLQELRGEVQTLRDENQALVARLAAASSQQQQPLDGLSQLLQEVNMTLAELEQCDTAYIGAAETGGREYDEETAEQFMQSYTTSCDRLELVSSQVATVLRQPVPGAAAQHGSPSGGDTEAALRQLFSDVLMQLVGRYRQINELKCDKFLSQATSPLPSPSAPSAPAAPAVTTPVPASAGGVKGMLSRFTGAPAAPAHPPPHAPPHAPPLSTAQSAPPATQHSYPVLPGGPQVLGGLGQQLGGLFGRSASRQQQPPPPHPDHGSGGPAADAFQFHNPLRQ